MHDPPKVTHAVEPELEPRELNSRIYALLTEETKQAWAPPPRPRQCRRLSSVAHAQKWVDSPVCVSVCERFEWQPHENGGSLSCLLWYLHSKGLEHCMVHSRRSICLMNE